MRAFTYIVLGSFPLSLAAYVGISYLLLSSLASKDPKPLEEEPDPLQTQFETVQFAPRGEKFKLEGWFLTPKKKATYSVIFVHGIATNRVSNEHALNIAYDFVKLGFNVLMFDQRAQGNSEGQFSSASYYEKFDVLGAFDFLTEEKKIKSEDIGLLGFSMGGAAALLASSIEPRITAVAVDSPFSDARKLIAQETARATGMSYKLAKLFVPMVKILAQMIYKINLDDMVPEEAVKKIKVPILLVHGDEDPTISHSHSKKIHKNAHKESELYIVPKGSHTGSYEIDRGAYMKRLFSYYIKRKSSHLF